MTIDLDRYTINKPFIQEWYRKNKDKNDNIRNVVSVWAANTSCPCIVLAFYLAEDVGFIKELTDTIDSLIEFYGYEEILNQPPKSPYLTMDRNNDIKE